MTTPVGASNFFALAATVPGTSTLGVPLGTGTNRFAVQIAYPIGAVIGSFIIGTDVLNDAVWNDVTRDVMSVSWDRGATAGSKPLAGQLNITLSNTVVNEQRKYSPAKSTFWGPGTMVRVIAGDPTSLTSVQITAITQTWDETFTANQRTVSITALEPTFMLVRVDDPPVSPDGSSQQNLNQRVDLICAAAQFPFTRETNYGAALAGTQLFQATTLTLDSISELQLTVDSVDGQFFMTKTALLEVCERAALYRTSSYVLGAGGNVPIKQDALTTANDDRILLSRVSLTRAGGSFTWSFSNQGVAARYHASSTSRTDLITLSDADLALVGNGLLNRGTQTLRPVSCTVIAPVTATNTAAAYGFLMAVDLYTVVNVRDAAYVTFVAYAVCRMSHTITWIANRVLWECALEFEPTPGSVTYGGSSDTTPPTSTGVPDYVLVDDSGNYIVDNSGNYIVTQ